jgi:hypothetical protein
VKYPFNGFFSLKKPEKLLFLIVTKRVVVISTLRAKVSTGIFEALAGD